MALPTSGLVLHNRVGDGSKCFTTSGNPPTGAVSDGDPVREWTTELSSPPVAYAFNYNDWTNTPPTFDADGMGNPAIYFSGYASPDERRQTLDTRNLANDANVGGQLFYAILSPFTWAVAFRVEVLPASGRAVVFGTASGAQTELYVGSDGLLRLRWFNFGSGVADIAIGPITLGQNHIAILNYTRSGGDQIQVYLDDGETPAVAQSVDAAQEHSGRPFSTGGESGSNTSYFNGWIGEVLVYNTRITGTDAVDLMAYLTSEWAASSPPGGAGGDGSVVFDVVSDVSRTVISGRELGWS